MTWAIFKMLLVLGTLLLILFFMARLMKRSRILPGVAASDSIIRVLGTKSLAPGKFLTLVEMGGEVLALGITESQITPLIRIENKEAVDRMIHQIPTPTETTIPLHYLEMLLKRPKRLTGGFWRKLYAK